MLKLSFFIFWVSEFVSDCKIFGKEFNEVDEHCYSNMHGCSTNGKEKSVNCPWALQAELSLSQSILNKDLTYQLNNLKAQLQQSLR
jgi:hypothetical protein